MNDTTPDTARVFAPLWKRKWIILAVGIVVGVATYFYYKHQTPSYLAKTSLYLGGTSEQGQGTGSNPSKALSGREIANQVELINSSIVGGPVHRKLRAEGDLAAVKARAKATASPTASFIIITTEARTPRAAVALANAYALGYVARQKTNYLRNVKAQLANTRQQLRRIETPTANNKKGQSGSALIQSASLASKINQLEADLAVVERAAGQTRQAAATPAARLADSPKRTRSSASCSACCWPRSPPTCSLASTAGCALARDVEAVFRAQHPRRAAEGAARRSSTATGSPRPSQSLLEPLRRLHTALQLGDAPEPRPAGARRGRSCSSAQTPATASRRWSPTWRSCSATPASGSRSSRPTSADPRQAGCWGSTARSGSPRCSRAAVTFEEAMQRVLRDPGAGAAPTRGRQGLASVATAVESRRSGLAVAARRRRPVANPPALLASAAMARRCCDRSQRTSTTC